MAVEIELKVRLETPAATAERLFSLGNYLWAYEKDDTYWYGADKSAVPGGIRIRMERKTMPGPEENAGELRETALVTWKTKEIRDGIEVNDERELSLGDCGGGPGKGAETFAGLLGALGFAPEITKEKRGRAWRIPPSPDGGPPVLAELSLVKRLGWFLELEIVTEDRSEQTLSESRRRLLSLLGELGLDEARIEERPYTRMLRMLCAGT
jgi:adenylate cyclase class 2